MKFSIITVCLNSEATIRKTLASIKRQNYHNYEVVLIDGLSTDRTLEIVAEYQEIVTVLVSEKDNGIYVAMNKGISRASGDVLFFLNSDDSFHDDSVLREASALYKQRSDLDLLFGNVIYLYPNQKVKRTSAHIYSSNIVYESLCHQAVFAKRSLFERYSVFNTQFRISADYYDWLIESSPQNRRP